MGTDTAGVYWLCPTIPQVCLPSQPYVARMKGGGHVNKYIYYGIYLVWWFFFTFFFFLPKSSRAECAELC